MNFITKVKDIANRRKIKAIRKKRRLANGGISRSQEVTGYISPIAERKKRCKVSKNGRHAKADLSSLGWNVMNDDFSKDVVAKHEVKFGGKERKLDSLTRQGNALGSDIVNSGKNAGGLNSGSSISSTRRPLGL